MPSLFLGGLGDVGREDCFFQPLRNETCRLADFGAAGSKGAMPELITDFRSEADFMLKIGGAGARADGDFSVHILKVGKFGFKQVSIGKFVFDEFVGSGKESVECCGTVRVAI